MKIVQISNHFYPCIGGVERIALDTSEGLIRKGHSLKVISLNRCANSGKKLKEKEKFRNILIERIPFIDFKYYKIAPGIFEKVKWADIIHVHGIGFFSDFLILTKALHKKPIIISTHGGIFHTKNISFLKVIYFYGIQKILLHFADKIIAVSRNDYKRFSEISDKVELIENGIDILKFKQGKKIKNTFLYLGRFSKNKRVDKLLEVFSYLKKKNFSLLIAGTDWDNLLKDYQNKSMELGIDGKVGFIVNPDEQQTKDLYASSDYFVSASRYEGFGLALVEAMASGSIPIVHKNEGFSTIIENNKSGFLVNFSNPEKTAGKILEIMSSNNERVRKNAVKKSKKFDIKNTINALVKVYEETK